MPLLSKAESEKAMPPHDWLMLLRKKKPVERKPAREMSPAEILYRFPMLVAHVICSSLGSATPIAAALVVKAAGEKKACLSEWMYSCYGGDAAKALRHAIRTRHHHHGYMADIHRAQELVLKTILYGEPNGMFASWF